MGRIMPHVGKKDLCFIRFDKTLERYLVYVRGMLVEEFEIEEHAQLEKHLTIEYFSFDHFTRKNWICRRKNAIWSTMKDIMRKQGRKV